MFEFERMKIMFKVGGKFHVQKILNIKVVI